MVRKSFWLLILLICYYLMVYIITPLLVNYLFESLNYMVELFAQIISVSIPIVFVLLYTKNNDKQLFNIVNEKNIEKKEVFLWIFLVIILFIGVNYLYYIFEVLYISSTKDYSIINIIPEFDILVFLMAILVLCILPSIFEELCYRGMYYDTFNKNTIVLFLSTIIFACLHSNILSFMNALLLGILLMKCYIETKSLKLIIILHFISNFLSIILTYVTTLPLSPLRILTDYANTSQMNSVIVFYVGIVILMIILFIFIFSKLSIKNNKIHKDKLDLKTTLSFVLMIIISLSLFIIKTV